MSGSSIFPSGPARRLWAGAVLATVVVLGLGDRAHAVDPDRALSQYIRDQWSREKGFPGGPVHAITQTADGYLWIGAEKGLVRFDGLSFRLLQPTGSNPGTGPTVLGVAAAPDGSLWARLRGPALLRYHDRSFESILSQIGVAESVVTAMFRPRQDVMLLATLEHGAVAYRGGTVTTHRVREKHSDFLLRHIHGRNV